MDKLPSGWKIEKMGQILNVKSSKRIFAEEYVTEGIPFFRSKEVVELSTLGITKGELFISIERYEAIKKKFGVPKQGDLLLTSVGTIGKTWIVDNRNFYYKDGNLTQLEGNDNIEIKFIQYYIKSPLFTEIIDEKVAGTAYNALTIQKINQLEIPLPPLPEQIRIVFKLDVLFSRVDKSIKLLEENIKHTKGLMASVLEEVFGGGDIPIGDLCFINPKKSEIRDFDINSEVSFLPMTDLKEHQIHFEIKQIKKLNEVNIGYTYFRDNDVLLAKVTPCFENGKAGIAQNLKNSIGFGSTEYHILRTKGGVLPEWIYYSIMTAKIRKEGVNNMTGSSGLKRVPAKFIETWLIKQPSIEEQRKIIQKIKEVDVKLKATVSFQQSKLTYLKALKSSILDRAFKGEL